MYSGASFPYRTELTVASISGNGVSAEPKTLLAGSLASISLTSSGTVERVKRLFFRKTAPRTLDNEMSLEWSPEKETLGYDFAQTALDKSIFYVFMMLWITV
jgi:hypothetical protein